MHPYEKIPLFHAGILLGIFLVTCHAWMLLRPAQAQGFLKNFPRSSGWGQALLVLGLAWFWLLVAPPGLGTISFLAMDFGDFNNLKPALRIIVPISVVLVAISIRDFLAVRALGLLGLMAAAPLLEAAFLKDPQSRLLVPAYAYVMLTISMFCVGMPYLFRDAVGWVTAKSSRWKLASLGGLVYGIAVLVCAVAFWRDY